MASIKATLRLLKQKITGGDADTRSVLRNITGAFLVKGLALLVSFATTPAYMAYFNNQEVLGLWFTLLSVLNWILTFDFGIGNGLRNQLTVSLSAGDRKHSKSLVSSAYASIGILTVVLTAILFPVSGFISWNRVFNIDAAVVPAESMLYAVRIVFVGILLQFFLKLINSVLYAMQLSAVNNALSLCSSVLILVSVLLSPTVSAEAGLGRMAWIHVLAMNLPLIVVTLVVFLGRFSYARPSVRCLSAAHVRGILRLGGLFFCLQFLYLGISETNQYLISHFCDNAAVVEYQVYYKVFSLVSIVFSLALTPMWSAVTKAYSERRFVWLQKSYRWILLASAAASIVEFLLVPLLPFIMRIWLHEDAVAFRLTSALAFAAMGSAQIWATAFATVANGTGKLRAQLWCYLLGAIVKVPLSLLLIHVFSASWMGIVLSTAVCLLPYCIVEPIRLRRNFRRLLSTERMDGGV